MQLTVLKNSPAYDSLKTAIPCRWLAGFGQQVICTLNVYWIIFDFSSQANYRAMRSSNIGTDLGGMQHAILTRRHARSPQFQEVINSYGREGS
jgi:hypothetical protein